MEGVQVVSDQSPDRAFAPAQLAPDDLFSFSLHHIAHANTVLVLELVGLEVFRRQLIDQSYAGAYLLVR
jgi:hypothetical protein